MFNFFKKKKTNSDVDKNKIQEENKEDILCSVNIELTYTGTIAVRYFWPLFNEKNAKHIEDIAHDFGILLYMINSGTLEKDMVETLSHMREKDNDFDKQFTSHVLKEWLKAVDASLDSSPVVSPSNVFGQYRQ